MNKKTFIIGIVLFILWFEPVFQEYIAMAMRFYPDGKFNPDIYKYTWDFPFPFSTTGIIYGAMCFGLGKAGAIIIQAVLYILSWGLVYGLMKLFKKIISN